MFNLFKGVACLADSCHCRILCDYVRCAGASYIVEDKTISRAVQDAVQRLTEAVNAIVGWQLETTTWLKRTLVVKHDQGIYEDSVLFF